MWQQLYRWVSALRAKVGSTQVEDTRLLFWVILFQKDKWLAPRDTHIVSVERCANVFAGYCQNSVSLLTKIFFWGVWWGVLGGVWRGPRTHRHTDVSVGAAGGRRYDAPHPPERCWGCTAPHQHLGWDPSTYGSPWLAPPRKRASGPSAPPLPRMTSVLWASTGQGQCACWETWPPANKACCGND